MLMMRDEKRNCVTNFGGSMSCRIKERSVHRFRPWLQATNRCDPTERVVLVF